MANSKKRKFVIRKLSKAAIAKQRAGDLFYFDPESWEHIMAAALDPRRRGAAAGLTSAQIAKGQATRRRNRAQRQKAAMAESMARRHAVTAEKFWKARGGPALRDRILCAMAPGRWHGAADIAAVLYGATATAEQRRYVRAILIQRLEPAGLVRAADNPAFAGTIGVGEVEPSSLWILSEAGEAERALVAESVARGVRYEKRPASALQPRPA